MGGRYRWLRAGDLNAFFGLALDNLSNLVILWGILVGLFRFPPDLVLHRMIPGTAMGVLAGDLIYSGMAFRLARRTGRDDVTAMPLGIDTPSLFVKGDVGNLLDLSLWLDGWRPRRHDRVRRGVGGDRRGSLRGQPAAARGPRPDGHAVCPLWA